MRRILLGCALLGIAGCGLLSRTVTKHAVEYNLAVERAANEVLLLNVIRAKEERPLHFTAITTVRGTASTNASAGISIPLGGDAASTFPLTLGLTGATGTSTIDVTVLDTKEFTQGLLNPVSLDTIEHFLAQDYEPTFLGRLLLHDADVSDGLRVETIRKMERVGVPFDLADGKSLAEIQVAAREQELTVRALGGRTYELARSVTKKQLRLGGAEDAPVATHTHSPEGVLYYLGQLMQRLEVDVADVELYDWEGEQLVLFYAVEERRLRAHLRALGVDREDPVLTCKYDGMTYVVPAYAHVRDGGEIRRIETSSMAVFAFVSQLLGLHKSHKDRPATGVVTVASG